MYVLNNKEVQFVSGGLEPVCVGSFVSGVKGFDMTKTLFYSAAFYGIPCGIVGGIYGAVMGGSAVGAPGILVGGGLGFAGMGTLAAGGAAVDSFIFYSLGSLFYTEKE